MIDIILIILLVAYIGVLIWSLITHLKHYNYVEKMLAEDDKIIDILDKALADQRELLAEFHNLVLKFEELEKSLFGEDVE